MQQQSKSIKQDTLKNSLWSLSTTFIDRIGALIFSIILARFLMPEGFGNYSLVLAIAFIFLTFSDLGINSALVRYFSDSMAKNKKNLAAAYFKFIFKVKFIFTLSVSLILIFLSYPISNLIFKEPNLFLPLFISGFYIFIFSFEGFFSSLFLAINKVRYISLKEIISNFLRIIFSLLVFFSIASMYHVLGILIGLTLTSIVVVLFILYYIKKFIPFLFSHEKKIKIDKIKIIKFISYLSLLSASAVFFSYVDLIMIKIFIFDPQYAGYYSAASKLVFSIAGIFSFTNILLPAFTQIKKNRFKSAFEKVFKYSMILTIPATFGLAILGKYFIKLIYGASFLPAQIPLTILSFLIIPGIADGLVMTNLSAKEKLKELSILFIFINFINIILNVVFIKIFIKYSLIYATFGAGLSTVICWYLYFFFSLLILKKNLNIRINYSSLIKPMVASIIMCVSIYSFMNFIKDINLFSGMLLVLFGMIAYFIVLFLIKGISIKDIKYLNVFRQNQ